jgi:GNAT superfamily N-acetyltransferase
VPFHFEPLAGRHDRAKFQCGVPALDDWFRARASQDQRRRVAQVFVALDDKEIVGFYSLSMFTLALDSLPTELSHRLPRYDAIPAAFIGRLARSSGTRGHGIGDLLLADAVKRVLSVTELVAAYAIVVDAKDDRGRQFYEVHGFKPLPSRPLRLFLLTQTAVDALKASEPRT